MESPVCNFRLLGHLFPGNLMAHRWNFDSDFCNKKFGRPPRRQPRKRLKGRTQMKLKSSRGIVMKLICCTALVVLASAVAVSQTPKSGALLTITSTDNSVNLKLYDSQIHSGVVQAVPSCTALTRFRLTHMFSKAGRRPAATLAMHLRLRTTIPPVHARHAG